MLKINKIHRRTLCVVYDDYNSTYEELLASDNDISIHQRHLKHLAIEVPSEHETRIHVAFLQNKSNSL